MTKRKLKLFVVPMIYAFSIIVFVFSMYFIEKLVNNLTFSKNDTIEYVDSEIVEKDDYLPVVSTDVRIIRPYLNTEVYIAKDFYDYTKDASSQEDSIIYYENTYMQNSGIDYAHNDSFDVVSILDGTVIDVTEDNILGTTVEIRHSNDLISVYQSLSNVSVKVDDTVIQGQVIAKSGTSNINLELGNHLHFEIFYQGKIVNPEEYYNKSLEEL